MTLTVAPRRPATRPVAVLASAVLASAVLVSAVLASGCTVHGLAFREDDRVEIESPDDREEVTLPFELRWTADDISLGNRPMSGDGNYFAVFIDREPMGRGQDIDSLADDPCERSPGCPDPGWLADRFVFVTTDTSLVIDRVPRRDEQNRTRARDAHEITIVLVDETGHRVGETSFSVEFFVRGGD